MARLHRHWRTALLAPLVLALAACADKAPLDTLNPKGPEARTIDELRILLCDRRVANG